MVFVAIGSWLQEKKKAHKEVGVVGRILGIAKIQRRKERCFKLFMVWKHTTLSKG
jgi:hypothetical protein